MKRRKRERKDEMRQNPHRGRTSMKKSMYGMLALLLVFITIKIFFAGGGPETSAAEGGPAEHREGVIEEVSEMQKSASVHEKEFKEIFRASEINEETDKRIRGISWTPEAPVELKDLRYLEVAYMGFDDRPHMGELVVHKCIADETVEIFRELYEAGYPIGKMVLVSDYGADDHLSMADNNTSAFCFRIVEGTDHLSKHAYGIAIDINPVQNPYVREHSILPEAGAAYLDRSDARMGMILEGDACYEAFKRRGWIWGGEWNTLKDYQHFQKDVEEGSL